MGGLYNHTQCDRQHIRNYTAVFMNRGKMNVFHEEFGSQDILIKKELFNIRQTFHNAKTNSDEGDEPPIKTKNTCWQAPYKFIFEYMDSSTIHGLKHLTVPKRLWFEHALWIVIIILAIFQTISQSLSSWKRYQNDPTVFTIERDDKSWNTSLASMVLCPEKKVDDRKLTDYIKRNYAESEWKDVTTFLKALAAVHYENLDEIPDISANIDPEKYMEIINEVKFELKYQFNTLSQRELMYKYTILETGICAALNTEISAYTSPELFFNKHQEPNATFQAKEGTSLDGELVTAILGINSPYFAQLSSPHDIPDVAVRKWHSPINHYWMIELSTLATTCSEDVRSLSIEQRKCRFKEESNLTISSVYTYNLCQMDCRQRLAIKYCSCAPHFYKKVEGVKTCDMDGLRCLAKHKVKLTKLGLQKQDLNKQIDCYCLPTCIDMNFITDNAKLTKWLMSTNLKYGIYHFPKTRVRRELIFGLTDLIVSIGATAGLFLGCSLLSFVELIYYFSLRILCNVRLGRKRIVRKVKIHSNIKVRRW